jgi:membrane protein
VKERLRFAYGVIEDAVRAYGEKGDAILGAAIAFFAMLSAAPLLVIAVGVAGLLFGQADAQEKLLEPLAEYMGPEAARMLLQLMREAREPVSGGLAAVLGVGILLFAATRLFVNLQRALNFVMGVRERRTTTLRSSAQSVVVQRARSFVMVLACGFVLTLFVIARLVLGVLAELIEPIAALPIFWRLLELVVSFAVFTLLVAVIYKVIPDVYLAWRDVWLGAGVTSALLAIGIMPIGWFLGSVGTTSAYGAAGTLVAILLFVYYAASIFFIGAEITRAWAVQGGSGIHPKPNVVRLEAQETDASLP